ncbi:Zinc finger protein like [Verticillium longisporum]|nr:Zinc finger protein like [Verticillium longisporum]
MIPKIWCTPLEGQKHQARTSLHPGEDGHSIGLKDRRNAALPRLGISSQPPEVPRGGADVLSPGSSTSGANSGSSQHSALSGLSSHYSAHGSWPTPSAPAYTLSSVSPTPNTLTHAHTHPYDHKASSYDPGSSMYNTTARAPHDPSPTYGHAHSSHANGHSQHQFPGSLFGHGGAASGSLPSHGHAHGHTAPGGGILNPQSTASTQPPTPLSAVSHVDPYTRPPSTPSYFSSASTPHQPSFGSAPHQPSYYPSSSSAPSPTTSTAASRGLHALAGHHSGMAPPQPYRPFQYGMQVPSMGGPIMSNLSNPSGPLSVMPGMNLPGYGGHHLQHIYGAHQNNPQERPFKCDQCPQSFNRNHDLKRHKRIHLAVKPFPCDHCDKSFSRKDALKRHRLVKGCGGEKTNGTETTRSPGGGSDGSESPLAPSIKKDDE